MNKCNICNSDNLQSVIHIPKVAIHKTLTIDPELNTELYGELSIVHCLNCSHVFNKCFKK